ncbi:hypothetical protein [Streptomyces camelliae]|uniref:DUF3558 domain-containing protein n=1 Tax=Streptomyces camelliae TaxID=3004093 RepID=A0ABY7NZH6_9ACTN|nr:hypothetical protein [Streptomyces sp. HUAS 2-6]WBO63480.1 hypothetical protein O1G22_11905 [Streptomyces sp. HUAS 2-6]
MEDWMARRFTAATSLFVMFGMMVGCSTSDEKKEYDVPRALCGISVSPDLVDPFLPPGKKLKVLDTRPVPTRKICRLDVDGKWALMANLEWWADDVSISTVAGANPQLGSAKPSDNEAYFSSGTGAVVQVTGCKNPEHKGQLLYTSLRVRDSGLADTTAMKKLATIFTKAVGKSDECS